MHRQSGSIGADIRKQKTAIPGWRFFYGRDQRMQFLLCRSMPGLYFIQEHSGILIGHELVDWISKLD